MTANQVAYWQLQEAKRHNQETELQGRQGIANQAKRWEAQSAVEYGNLDVNRDKVAVDRTNAETRKKETAIKQQEADTKVASAFISALNPLTKFLK